jgi:hypothetical protein
VACERRGAEIESGECTPLFQKVGQLPLSRENGGFVKIFASNSRDPVCPQPAEKYKLNVKTAKL